MTKKQNNLKQSIIQARRATRELEYEQTNEFASLDNSGNIRIKQGSRPSDDNIL